MPDVPAQMSDPRHRTVSTDAGTIITVERISEHEPPPARPPIAAPPPPPIWGGMDSRPPPTRDFRGPFLFVAALVGVALTAVGLLVYAVSMERGRGMDAYYGEAQTEQAGGGIQQTDGDTETVSLWVNGAPYGATLRVNTDSVGTLPMTIENLPVGDHLLTIEANGLALDTLISVGAGGTTAVFLRLEGLGDVSETVVDVETRQEPAPPPPEEAAPPSATTTGLLRIVSQPAGAAIQLDGAPAGTTPLILPEVVAGRYTVTATLSGRQAQQVDVEVIAERDQMVRLSLPAVAGPGTLEVLARPWGSIYIDGALKKSNTDVLYRTDLPAGTYEVRVVHPTFGSRTRRVTVGSGQVVMEVFDLTAGASNGGS